jgi:hypothetical protein
MQKLSYDEKNKRTEFLIENLCDRVSAYDKALNKKTSLEKFKGHLSSIKRLPAFLLLKFIYGKKLTKDDYHSSRVISLWLFCIYESSCNMNKISGDKVEIPISQDTLFPIKNNENNYVTDAASIIDEKYINFLRYVLDDYLMHHSDGLLPMSEHLIILSKNDEIFKIEHLRT